MLDIHPRPSQDLADLLAPGDWDFFGSRRQLDTLIKSDGKIFAP